MKFKALTFYMLIYFANVNLYPNDKENKLKWSSYQGKMSWENARTRCDDIGMRIPTKLELQDAFRIKLTKAWVKDAAIFWTEEEFSIPDAFDQFVSFNPIYWTSEEAESHQAFGFHSILGSFHKTNKLVLASVRCLNGNSTRKK